MHKIIKRKDVEYRKCGRKEWYPTSVPILNDIRYKVAFTPTWHIAYDK